MNQLNYMHELTLPASGRTLPLKVILFSKRSRCLILWHDKLKFFDEAEILFSANVLFFSLSSGRRRDQYNPSSACAQPLLHIGLYFFLTEHSKT